MATLRFCTGWPVTSTPSKNTLPDVGVSRPAMRRIRLVLPDSVGPSRTLSVPCCKASETPRICSSAPTVFDTFRSSSICPPPWNQPLFRRRVLLRVCRPAHELLQRRGLLSANMESSLGAPPQHVLGRDRPLILHQISYFGFVEIGTEMSAEFGFRSRQPDHFAGALAIEPHETFGVS